MVLWMILGPLEAAAMAVTTAMTAVRTSEFAL
jgi:hypothetical protein